MIELVSLSTLFVVMRGLLIILYPSTRHSNHVDHLIPPYQVGMLSVLTVITFLNAFRHRHVDSENFLGSFRDSFQAFYEL